MTKVLRRSFILVSVLLTVVLILNLFMLQKLNKLEGQIEQIDITVDCTHSNTDAIKVFYIQSSTDAEENQETDGEVDNEVNDETEEEKDIVTNINPTTEQVYKAGIYSTTNYSEAEINTICSVVEAETHGGDSESKIHIVHVILNRVNSPRFPNSIIEVCNQANQFASRGDIEQSTIDAVYTGLATSDTTQGALFFHSGALTDTFNGANYLFTDNVGHHFYK